MIQIYPKLSDEAIERQGKTYIYCDHQDVAPAIYEDPKYVTEDMVGEPCTHREGVWKEDEVGVVILESGKMIQSEAVGPRCDAYEVVEIQERPYEQGNVKGVEIFAELPEGWASTSKNALDGAADYCPLHADRISESKNDVPEAATDAGTVS